MSPGAVLPHRQCGTSLDEQRQFHSETTMETLKDFETEYLSSDPEVFVDFLSIKSLKQRYVGRSNSDNGVFCPWNSQLDDDFETFVQEFPIDDNISECFAYSSDDTIKDLEGVVSEDESNVRRKSKNQTEKEARSKVSEAVINIEKKLAETRRSKGGTNFFRRKAKQSVLPKKSFSFDDLRMTGTSADHASSKGNKSSTRRCRVLQEANPHYGKSRTATVGDQRMNDLYQRRLNSVDDTALEKVTVSDQFLRESSSSAVESQKDGLKSCLRNGDSKEDRIDLRLIKPRPLAPDKMSTGKLKSHRSSQFGILRHRILRKALRESTKAKSTTTSEKQVSSVCMACRDLKLTETGSTTAHSAAYMGHLQCLQALVENAADITAVNHDGLQPSQVALSTGHFDCWNYLTVAELSHVLLRELCNYGSLIERITTQLESVRSEMVKVKHCLEKKSQDLNRQVKYLLELTTTISRNLVSYPSNKQKCLGQPSSMYQDVQDSLTLLERIDRKLNDMRNDDCIGDAGSDKFRGLEMAVRKTEDLLLDDVHMNDIRQLENVQKRNRVIRNFLIEDEQRLNNRLRNNYAESVSSESIVSRGSRARKTRAIVEPVLPSIASTSSSHLSSRDRRVKSDKKRRHHNHHHHHHRHKGDPNLSKLPPPTGHHPTAGHTHYQRRHHRSRSASSKHSPLRSDIHSEAGRVCSSSSSTGSSASFSCSDSEETASSDWETTSQESAAAAMLDTNNEIPEEIEQTANGMLEEGVNRGAARGPSSGDWSFLRSAVQDDRHKSKNRDSLSQSSLEVCIGNADRASSVGSLRRHRLANHFLHIEKDTKQKSGLMERVIKGDDDRHETGSVAASSATSKAFSENQEKRTASASNMNYSQKANKSGDGAFSSASSSSPASSRMTVIRNVALDDVKATRAKATSHMNLCNTNTLREELIGRCRQVPVDIHNPSLTVGKFEDSFQEKPWYDVSDDETSVCTWTNEMPGYESESSYYQ